MIKKQTSSSYSLATAPRLPWLLRRVNMLRSVAAVTYKEWAAYRSHMLLSLFIGPVFFLVQRFVWTAVFQGRDQLGGFDLQQMIYYYGVATIIYYLTMDFADWNLQMHIRSGSFITFMLRPLHHRFFALAQKTGHRILGFFFEFLPIWLIFLLVFRMPLIPVYPLWSILSVALAFMMMFFINYSVGILAFWFVRTDGLRSLSEFFWNVLAGIFVPLTLFPLPLQRILFFLPFQFTTYVPVRVFLGSYELAGVSLPIPLVVGVQALAVLLMWGISELLWRLGTRKFTAVGV